MTIAKRKPVLSAKGQEQSNLIRTWISRYSVKVPPKSRKELGIRLASNAILIRECSNYMAGHFANAIECHPLDFILVAEEMGHEFFRPKVAYPDRSTRITVPPYYLTITTMDVPHPREANLWHIPVRCPNCGKPIVYSVHCHWSLCTKCDARWDTIPSMVWSKRGLPK